MFKTLQTYRGLAAAAVVGFHLTIGFGDPRYFGRPVLEFLTWRMNLGVDFFFVLSGFIIMMAHVDDLGKPQRLWPFIKKRFLRIYPIYWVYVGVFCGLLLAGFGTAAKAPDSGLNWLTTFSLVRLSSIDLPISPAWTLIHEIAFYMVFAILILNLRMGLVALALWFVIILLDFQYPAPWERTTFTTYFAAYNLDFGLGMAAFLFYRNYNMKWPLIWVAVGFAALASLLWLEAQGATYMVLPFLYALSFSLIILGSVIWEKRSAALPLGVFTFLGDASYTIYLTHEPIVGLLLKIAKRLRDKIEIGDIPVYLIIYVMTVALGCIAYVAVEKPVIAFARALIGNRLKQPRVLRQGEDLI